EDFYFSLEEKAAVLGSAMTSALKKSRDLSSTQEERREFTENAPDMMSGKLREWYDTYHQKWLSNNPERKLFEKDLEKKRYTEWIADMLRIHSYKNEKALFKNMQLCSVSNIKNEILFLPFGKGESKKNDFKFAILSGSPLEIIGAAVTYSIARCTGKGAYLIAKKLFPDGVPDTFEDYLKSLSLQKA
ncbi:MAG: CdiI family contact-dependent growth inhibition immunity protein, partial [Holosporaceae bacterium]|nr:CdiI family contact-dependent growth inhibition immunity protein [Holosporaceae bacterium]